MTDPIAQFQTWLAEATRAGAPEPTAMSVATVDAENRPSVRILLLKAVDARGFVFYTNLESHKANDLKAHPFAALCFHWPVLERQVRVEGHVKPVSDEEADAYFATRPRLSQLGAWASKQSRPMEGYWELERAVAGVALRYPIGSVPRPPFWSGFRVKPEKIEFWRQKPFRQHERIVFTRAEGGTWDEQWLFP
ncbi:pyridoxamine 5'-phosphate oxidase [Opitutaceae bacterium EW11]|nr:pyridoxamine 5'-phosphate oxidase [Opitutaceae bacterium EW11]